MATIAHSLNWTINEVRSHSWRDLAAMDKVIEDENRRKRMRQSAKGARR